MTITESNALILWAASQIRERRQRLREELEQRDPTLLEWADRWRHHRTADMASFASLGTGVHAEPTGKPALRAERQRPPAYTDAARAARRSVKRG